MSASRFRMFIGLGGSLICLPVLAALGGAPTALRHATIAGDAPTVTVRSAGAGASAYRIQESQTDAGTAVREYVDANGTVFCVTWQGPQMPDLQSLFGDYYPRYVDYLAARRDQGIRGPVQMQADALVVESGGRMRGFFGRAYVPSLLPANVEKESLQ